MCVITVDFKDTPDPIAISLEPKNASDQRSRRLRNDKRTWAVESSRGRNDGPGVMDLMEMIGAFTTCLESFTRRFESPNSHTQSYRDITPNVCDVWVKKGIHV